MSTGIFYSSTVQKAKDAHSNPIVATVPYTQFAFPSGSSSALTFNAPPTPVAVSDPLASLKKGVNSKRTAEELDIAQQTSKRFSERLTQDQTAVLHPDVDSPFVDEMDVINRLLPYHLFQQPRDDLDSMVSKGKGKADLHNEIQHTKFALECYKRRQNIINRWRQVLIKLGGRPSPDDQSYCLAQAILEADRVENAFLGNELRTTRAQAERIEREKRAAASASAGGSRMSQFPSAPQVMMPTLQATPYYRPYPYGYAQPYGTAPAPPATFSTTTPPAAPALTSAPTAYSPYLPNGAIPVQLPVGSLPALHALGIIPVPAASTTSDGQQGQGQTAAVLRGSSANGNILNLEINVSLLQSTQMTGLAMVLNSLVARTQNVAAATANAATTAASSVHSSGSNSTTVKQPSSS